MKYFFTLLLIAFTGLAFQAEAQNTTTCNPAFTSQHINGMTIKFTPVTTDSPLVQHKWYFEGTGPYYQVSPTYTFNLPGVQHVKHIVIRHNPNGVAVCADSTTADIIAEGPCNLTADFFAQTAGTSPLRYYFAPSVTPYVQSSDSTIWTFGDGSSSTSFYPEHTYASPGTYTVCLRVRLNNTAPGAQPCMATICKQVTVSACDFQVYFSHIADSANNALIHFTNQTPAYAAGDSILWTFGDGTTSSQNNPNHVYANPGTYNVCLIIRKYIPGLTTPCVREYCKVVTVLPAACTLVASFTVTHDSTGLNINNYHFTNTSTPLASTDSIRWTFGDGTSSNQVSPNHVYTQSGTYTVCLRVIKRNANGTLTNCISEVCHQVVVTLPTTCTLVASFTVSHDSTGVSINNYHFTNTSAPLAATDSIRWSFGDGTFSNQVSPNHVYTQSGTYNVCLVIIKRNPNGGLTNCISEVCHTVVVTLPTTCALVASFTASHDSTGTAVNYWHFTNTSAPLATTDSIRWTFGDGTSSNQVSPYHYYAQPGTYNVCLRIIKRNPNGVLTNCISEVCHTIVVTQPTTCTLVASFTVSHDSIGTSINNYHFTNTSVPLAATDSIRWSFGDGTFSNQVSPNHVYTQAGTYTVCLLIIKRNANGTLTNCASDVCHTVTVVLPNTCNLTVGFTSYRDSAAANLYTYHFINLSTPLAASDSIRWTFGDGTSSNQVNPVHAYAQPGTYTVCLRVIKRNPNGVLTTCVRDTCKVLVITQICNIQPHYTWHADSVNYRKIYFTNTTISPVTNVTAIWYFGDGTTATSWNAVHEYAQAGTYNVCLRIASGNCVTYYCDSIHITVPVPPCTQLSNYHFTRSTADSQTYYFAPNYVGAGIQYTWTFGDGTGTQPGPNATHHFATAGNYTVCLTAYKNSNCASTTCSTIQVHAQPNCGNSTIDYNYHRDSLVPNRVTFTAYSNLPIVDQVWTITKQPATTGTGTATIHLNNPTYVFIDTGYYRVCLRATLANGCVKEYCNYIHIEQLMPGTSSCTLQAYPNPAGAEVHVSLSLAQPLMLYAYIYNSANVLVVQKQQQGVVGNNVIGLNTANLPAGIYTIRVVYGNAFCSTSFVKQ